MLTDAVVATGFVHEGRVTTVWSAGCPVPEALALAGHGAPLVRQDGRTFALIPVESSALFWLELGERPGAYRPSSGHRRVLAALRRGHLAYGWHRYPPPAEVLVGGAVYDLASLEGLRSELVAAVSTRSPTVQTPAVTAVVELLSNLWRHGRGGTVTLAGPGPHFTLTVENYYGRLPFERVAVPLLHPCPSPYGKGFWLLLAQGTRLDIDPGPPARVTAHFTTDPLPATTLEVEA